MRACAGRVALIGLGVSLAAASSAAQDWHVVREIEPDEGRYEASAGADATAGSWSLYGGMTTAIGGGLRADGFRLRSAGGWGAYAYWSPRWDGVARVPVHFTGVQSYTDLLAGYQATLGPWIVKVFAGGTQERHVLAPFDTENAVQGGRIGFKGALETWLALGDNAFVQTDSAWSEVFSAYSARIRAGYRLWPALSAGLEAAAVGNAAYDAGRVGSFARIEWSAGEISASGGLAGTEWGVTGAYGTVGLMFRF